MVYGKVIIIKKNGEDGSKYPVKEKSVLIGNSEKCSIRIYNSQVAPKHCQLIVDDKGQVKLRNFSKITYLNDKLINQEDVTLCHGDIFKIGERLARWEYLPSSKYYRQLLSPSGRLVAVVIPQQRSQASVATPGTSAVQSSKNTLLGSKRKLSEKVNIDEGSTKKILKTNYENKTPSGIKNMAKIISGRHSFRTAKMLFSPKLKMRKSTSSINSSKTCTLNKERKAKLSLLPWTINPVSPPKNRKSGQRKLTPIKQATNLSKLNRNSSLIKNLNTIAESPLDENNDRKRLTRGLSKSPAATKSISEDLTTSLKKNAFENKRLINSESKLNFHNKAHLKKLPQKKRLSLTTNYDKKTSKKSPLKNVKENITKKNLSTLYVSDKGRSTNNLKSENFLTKTPEDGVKFIRSSPRKSQIKSSESNIASSSKSKRSFGKELKISLTRSNSKIYNANQSMTSPAKEIAKASPLKLTGKKKLKGVRRKRSPSMTSEKAAKKLKISSPSKPDKNKKAALLVLGKANRKHLLALNVKVLLKQKIIKKAIKQSTIGPVKKELKREQLSSNYSNKKAKNSTNQKRKKNAEVLKEKKETFQILKVPEEESVNSRILNTKKIQLNEIKNSEVVLNSSKAISAKENTPKPTKVKSLGTSSEFTKSKNVNDSNTKMNDFSNVFTKSENYIFNSNRRCSKRLSSKKDVSKPDFIELSPTALGLMPKNIEIFKTPQPTRRRSISLATPKNNCINGVVKSTSTSKIGQKKNVRFSSKDLFNNSENVKESFQNSSFNFENIHTPNITLEVFVSPLSEKTNSYSGKKSKHSESTPKVNPVTENSLPKNFKSIKNESKSIKCARKLLQSPQAESSPKEISFHNQSSLNTKICDVSKNPKNVTPDLKNTLQPRSPLKNQNSLKKCEKSPKNFNKNSDNITEPVIEIGTPRFKSNVKNDSRRISQSPKAFTNQKNVRSSLNNSSLKLNETKLLENNFNIIDAKQSFKSVENNKVNATNSRRISVSQKENKNNLKGFTEVKKLFKTPQVQKSPKNELNDLRGVKELFLSKGRKSPKNELSDVTGVKQLFKSPRLQKSPKNDLTNVAGVKRLLRTPKENRSPKNDLSDFTGVKQLFKSPRLQKSPKNDLTNVAGVKRLLRTPKENKSPKNDLRDIAGVKQLFKSPRLQKSPKNDLTNVAGIKRLLRTPKENKSPKNDLSDIAGVKQLFKSPRLQKSPKNDLTNVAGIKRLLRTPKENKSPKNDLNDVIGIQQLFKTPRVQRSPKNDLNDVVGVEQLFKTPKENKNPENDLSDVTGEKQLIRTSRPLRSPKNDLGGVDEINESVKSPKQQKRLSNNFKASEENMGNSFDTILFESNKTGIKEKLFTKNTLKVSPYKNKVQSNLRSPLLNNFIQLQGRRTLSPSNYPINIKETRQLFTKNKPVEDLNISLSGVAELFDIPLSTSEINKSDGSDKLIRKKVVKMTSTKKKSNVISGEEATKKRGRPPKRVANTNSKKPVGKKEEISRGSKSEEKKRKIDKTLETKDKVNESRRKRKLQTEMPSSDSSNSKKSVKIRSRSASNNSEPSRPKLRRRCDEDVIAVKMTEKKTNKALPKKKPAITQKKSTSKRTRTTEKSSKASEKKTLPRVQSKISSKSTKKVQIKRSQAEAKKTTNERSEKLSSIKIKNSATQAAARKETKSKAETKSKSESRQAVKTKGVKLDTSKQNRSPIATRSSRRI